MPAGVTYDVNAFLRTQGSFQQEMATSARAADKMGKSYESMSSRMIGAGTRIRGTFMATAAELAKGAVFAGAAGLAGAVAMAAREGIRFNNEMEQGALGLGTMYTTFGVAANSAAVLSGEMSEFAKSTELAASMQQELFDIAKKSPATFEDVVTTYKSMAPAITGVTGDLARQRDLMKNMALLGFATNYDYKQLGMDIGRVTKGMAEMDNLTFQQMRPAFEKAFEAVTGEKAVSDFNAQWNKAAKLDPDQALRMVEMVGESMGSEVSDAFGSSFGGMAATIQSQGQVLAGAFGKPLMTSMKKAMAQVAGDDSPLNRLETVASFAGQQLAGAADKLFAKLISGADYVADNWMMIATKIQQAGVLAGAALKAASVVATARLVAGYGMIAIGKGAAAAQAIGGGVRGVAAYGRKKTRGVHMAMGRGMAGKPGGSMLGKAMGKMMGGLDKTGLFRHLDVAMLKFATLGTVIAGSTVALGGIALAFSGVIVVVGGLAAYLVSSWGEIKTSIMNAMMDGRLSLVPLITSLYTFYERMKLVGQAIFGNISAANVATSTLGLMTEAVNFASMTLGGMINVVAYGIEAWGALKLGLSAVFMLIGDGLRMMAKIPGVGDGLDDAVKSIDSMTLSVHNSAQGTFTQAQKFKDAAKAIANTQLNPMQLAAAEKKAKGLESALADMLSGDDKKGGKGGGRAGRQTNVKAELTIVTTDPDMDRLMASFIGWAERQSDKRTQPYEGAVPQGT